MAFRESSSSLKSSLSVSQSYSAPPHLVNSSFGASPPFLSILVDPDPRTNRWVGVVGGVFVCASWALRATDRAIPVVVGPDDTDSITPTPDTPLNRRSKWTGTALRARLGNPSQQPINWADGGDGNVLLYPGSPSGTSLMLHYSPYSPTARRPSQVVYLPLREVFRLQALIRDSDSPRTCLYRDHHLTHTGDGGHFWFDCSQRHTLVQSFPTHATLSVEWISGTSASCEGWG
jgi:hypothetical protein